MTVQHLDVILVNDQLDALFLNVFISTPLLPTGPSDSHPPECVIPDGVLIQVGPPDDEHLLLETCRDVEINTLRKSASSWSLTRRTNETSLYIYIYIYMYVFVNIFYMPITSADRTTRTGASK